MGCICKSKWKFRFFRNSLITISMAALILVMLLLIDFRFSRMRRLHLWSQRWFHEFLHKIFSFIFSMIIIYLRWCARTFSTFNSIICLFWMLIDKWVKPWFFLSLIFKLEISFFFWFIVVFITSMSKGPFIYYLSTFLINRNIFTNFLSIFLYVLKKFKLQHENFVKV